LSKKSLLARFIRLFPSIQSIVGGEAAAPRDEDSDELVVSKASFDERTHEYEDLIQVKIPKNKEDIAEARSHGDLRENAEYKMARQEQDLLLAHKNELEVAINKARVTDFTDATVDMVSVGSVVELEQASSKDKLTYSILGAWDGNPEKNILSYKTPLAKALMGKSKDDSVAVEIDGYEETYTIKDIKRWVDVN
jgi:transcription elongation factor GreA